MGIQNQLAAQLAVPELTTTVLTKTLTGLAGGGRPAVSVRRVVSVAAMALGALAGGLLVLHASVAAALAVAVALGVAVTLAAHLASRSGGVWIRPGF
jgi:hypothetical protein